MAFTKFNALDQAMDIAGSLVQVQDLSLTDESAGLGSAVVSPISSAAVASVSGGIAVVTVNEAHWDASAFVPGNWLQVSGADSAGNNGTFIIVAASAANDIQISNPNAVASDANNGSITVVVRRSYSLQDDLNYVRTDRAAIKGGSFDSAIPTYTDAYGTAGHVANLSQISGKTTDAKGFIFSRKAYLTVDLKEGPATKSIVNVGKLSRDSSDKEGVPCYDVGPYAGNDSACFVLFSARNGEGNPLTWRDPADGAEYVIFGKTFAGDQDPTGNMVEIHYYQVLKGIDVAYATPFTWTEGNGLGNSAEMTYGYFQSLEDADESAFRRVLTLGLSSDADMRTDINDLQVAMGVADGERHLGAELTNKVANYPFEDLSATPTAVEALNVLNAAIGDRDYDSAFHLSSSETVATSLLALDQLIGSDLFDGAPHLTNSDSITLSLKNLANAIGDSQFVSSAMLVPGDSVTVSLQNISDIIGSDAFSGAPHLTDGDTITESLAVLANTIGSLSWDFHYQLSNGVSVSSSLHTLDNVIGQNSFSGAILSSGDRITMSLQKLSDAIGAMSFDDWASSGSTVTEAINAIVSKAGSMTFDGTVNTLLSGLASPTVTSALQTLGDQFGTLDFSGNYLVDGYTMTEGLQALSNVIGDNSAYTGGILSNGQTVAESLQALSNALMASEVVRHIELVAADVPANTAHTLPGGMSYTQDDGGHLWVFSRGILRHPGSVADGGEYAETSSTSVTFYSALRAGDVLDFFKVSV